MPLKRQGSLGEFEHLVLLAVLRHADGVFGSLIGRELETRAGRRVSRGALYATLERLERKGFRVLVDRGRRPRARRPSTPPVHRHAAGAPVLREYRRAVQNLVVGIEELL